MYQLIFLGNAKVVKPILKRNGLRPVKICSNNRVNTVMVNVIDSGVNRSIIHDLYNERKPVKAGSLIHYQEI